MKKNVVANFLNAQEAYRGPILHFLQDPTTTKTSYEYFEDGVLLVDQGRIVSIGKAEEQLKKISKETKIHQYNKNSLILPGFIDTHIHYPQVDMIASYGSPLLEWLQKYTFPHEKRFSDKEYASKVSKIFINELLRNGTTTALVFCAAAKESVDALFEQAKAYNMRIIAGGFLADRNIPEYLMKPLDQASLETEEFIKKWHGNGRLLYAVTPRFALTSSEEQLKMVGEVLQKHPDVYLHTHLSENIQEVESVKKLFPWCKNYLDVYKHYGLVRPRSLFAHSIHVSNEEIMDLVKARAAVSFCPTSNLFLGSGLFRWRACKNSGLLIGIGTDIGAGTSFSIPKTLGEGYKVAALQGEKISPFEAFYHATLGGAKALYLDKYIGNFEPGKEADFVVLDIGAIPLMSFRLEEITTIEDKLFLLMTLGDDRNVKETYIMGKRQTIAS